MPKILAGIILNIKGTRTIAKGMIILASLDILPCVKIFEEVAMNRQEKQKPLVDDNFKTVKDSLTRIAEKTSLHDICDYLLIMEKD